MALTFSMLLLISPSGVFAQAVGDFNDDGFADLAIGVPGESINSGLQAGAVHVIYGSANRLRATGSQFWHLDSPGVPGVAETADFLGRALAVGDFNGDGFDDLAIGIPGRTVSGDHSAGAVLILYGTVNGLAAANASFWHQDTTNIEDTAEFNDRFGASLAAGDFDGDGYDDLAIGVPGERGEFGIAAGAVAVLYGSISGITSFGDQFFQQDTTGINGTAEGNDQFGEALASGDFNNDGRDDLVVGVPNEGFDGKGGAGLVHVLFGTPGGLTALGSQTWHQNSPGIQEVAESEDSFGAALAVGDFNNDGFDDLAIGVPKESVGSINNAGAVHVLRGSPTGLVATGARLFTQNTSGMRDRAEANDRFGNALAAGDFNGDGFDDLAIGVPNESIAGIPRCGAVAIIFGSAAGLTTAGNQFWHQNSNGMLDQSEPEDGFAATLAAGDFDDDGRADLAIGVPYENIGATDAGAVAVMYGGANGLRTGPDQFWHQNVSGIAGSNGRRDYFGLANSD